MESTLRQSYARSAGRHGWSAWGASLLLVALLATTAHPARARDPWVQAEVVNIESLTQDVKRVRIKLPRGYTFQAGQFALLRVPARFVE